MGKNIVFPVNKNVLENVEDVEDHFQSKDFFSKIVYDVWLAKKNM